jgi:16S rRNA (cytosine1402-N4)-methyltransferase
MSEFSHHPVLLQEVLQYLDPKPGEVVIDGTLGGGGHSWAIAKRIAPNGFLLGIDADPAALDAAEKTFDENSDIVPYTFVQGTYRNIRALIEAEGITQVDKILVDLGISSYDLDASGRGFSFQRNEPIGEPLDMRFDPTGTTTAARLLNDLPASDLQRIFSEFGEERHANRIAQTVVRRRVEKALLTTMDLNECIRIGLPAATRFLWQSSARRIYQALRIAVNRELETIVAFLPEAFSLLRPGGRLAVISFQSLEDRIVKRFAQDLAKGCICPPEFPECRCGHQPLARQLTKKPIVATEAEAKANPRSVPAKMRVIEKLV